MQSHRIIHPGPVDQQQAITRFQGLRLIQNLQLTIQVLQPSRQELGHQSPNRCWQHPLLMCRCLLRHKRSSVHLNWFSKIDRQLEQLQRLLRSRFRLRKSRRMRQLRKLRSSNRRSRNLLQRQPLAPNRSSPSLRRVRQYHRVRFNLHHALVVTKGLLIHIRKNLSLIPVLLLFPRGRWLSAREW